VIGVRAVLGAVTIAVVFHAGVAHAETVAVQAQEPHAPFLQHEPYLASGFTYFASDRRVLAGLGGGPGYRLNLGSHFAAFAEARWLVYSGTSFTGAAGLLYRLRIESWEPIAGLQATFYGGDSIQVVSSASPTPPPAVAWAVQARLGLLRFVHGPFTVTSLALDWGYGADVGTLATAVTVTFIDIGFRL
jgi:hypothetical protein